MGPAEMVIGIQLLPLLHHPLLPGRLVYQVCTVLHVALFFDCESVWKGLKVFESVWVEECCL